MSAPKPMSARQQRWRRLVMHAKSMTLPVVLFWTSTLGAMALFFALLIYAGDNSSDDYMVMGGFAVATAVGISMGQVAALLRLRTWVILGTAFTLWLASVFVAAYLGGTGAMPDEVVAAVFISFILFPFFLLAGLWSLRVHMGLLAIWAPLVYLSGCILIIANELTDSSSTWLAGSKWAVWDVLSAPVLLLGVLITLVYFVARERHRLHMWRFGSRGPDIPFVQRTTVSLFSRGGLAALGCGRGGCGGVLAIGVLGIALTVATALSAPYLWRSSASEGGRPSGGTATEETFDQGPPNADDPPPSGCNQEEPAPEEAEAGADGERSTQEIVQEAVKKAGSSMLALLLLLVLAFLGLFIFGPPARRLLLLRHLRRPLWPVPPTREVLQHWRIVEIALADIGVHRRLGDSASSLATRALGNLPADLDPLALLEAAAITDRVVFGLGMRPTDTDRAARTAQMLYSAIWELMDEGEKVRAMYRWM